MAAQAFESSIWEAEAGRLGRGQKSALMLLFETGFPFFGLVFLVQTERLTSQPWESPVSTSVVLVFIDTTPGFRTKLRFPIFQGKHFTG